MIHIRIPRAKGGVDTFLNQCEFATASYGFKLLPEGFPLLVLQLRNQYVQTVFHSRLVRTNIAIGGQKNKPF